jgi:hypothetical protein
MTTTVSCFSICLKSCVPFIPRRTTRKSTKSRALKDSKLHGYGAKLKDELQLDLASRGECGCVIYLEGDSYYTEYDDVVQAFLQYLDVDAGIEIWIVYTVED